ncbi:MAG: hypothetical protein LH477_12295, partial [Nocardioides sp.]|nr:hypothetical protein [Nocardioides sp.]
MRRSRAVLSWAGCVLVLAGGGEADDSRFDADPVARATSTPSASVEASPRGDVGGTSPVAPPSATEPAA